jgi:16S rRNA (guanine527-N7)-methyltransferase
MNSDDHLLSVLQLAQDGGVIGNTDLGLEVSRARVFIHALQTLTGVRDLLDIGSGGGLPGLVIAHDFPELRVTLIDRREKRTDLLTRQAHRLRQHVSGSPIEVICSDVASLHGHAHFDAITSRSFGSPEVVLDTALPLLRSGGWLLVSEPPNSNGDRWPQATLSDVNASIEIYTEASTSLAIIHHHP